MDMTIDIAVAYNRYKFLGFEFLTWLWHAVDTASPVFREVDENLESLALGNRVVLENRVGEGVESVTIKGDDAGLEEGLIALGKGAIVTELNLVYVSGGHEWRFTLKGESFNVAGLKIPETAPLAAAEDIEATVLEKIFLYEKATNLLDGLYRRFLAIRLSGDWGRDALPAFRRWIRGER